MPATIRCMEFSRVSKRNREWLSDEFFHRQPNRSALLYRAEHYRDIAATNKVASDEDRVEFKRRAKYLTRMAARLR